MAQKVDHHFIEVVVIEVAPVNTVKVQNNEFIRIAVQKPIDVVDQIFQSSGITF